MTSRERFEAWARTLPFRMHFDCFTGTDEVTCYAAPDTQLAWESWQAAARAERIRVAKRCAELMRERKAWADNPDKSGTRVSDEWQAANMADPLDFEIAEEDILAEFPEEQ